MHDPLTVAFKIPRPWPSSFHTKMGRRRYWPAIVTVWHREPRGHDSGHVCKRYRRTEAPDGWKTTKLRGWRWHVHHWRVQVPALQELRRRMLTRCAWCGGRSRKGDQVNVSHQWHDTSGRWWRGEPGLFHRDCSSVENAHGKCLCEQPGKLAHGNYGTCANCANFRPYGSEPDEADRLLAGIAEGKRIPVDMRPRLESLWGVRLRRKGIDPKTTASMWPKR